MNDTAVPNTPTIADALFARTMAVQSELLDLLQSLPEGMPAHIRPLELVYFSAAMTTYVYVRFGNDANARATLDRFTRHMLCNGLRSAGGDLSFSAATRAYRKRFGQYNALVAALFNPDVESGADPAAMLLAHAFECITQSSRHKHVFGIWGASVWAPEFLLDLVVFVKQELGPARHPGR